MFKLRTNFHRDQDLEKFGCTKGGITQEEFRDILLAKQKGFGLLLWGLF